MFLWYWIEFPDIDFSVFLCEYNLSNQYFSYSSSNFVTIIIIFGGVQIHCWYTLDRWVNLFLALRAWSNIFFLLCNPKLMKHTCCSWTDFNETCKQTRERKNYLKWFFMWKVLRIYFFSFLVDATMKIVTLIINLGAWCDHFSCMLKL